MRILDVAIIAFRVVAIYMVAQGLLAASQIGPMWVRVDGGVNESLRFLALVSLLTPLLAGVILWCLAPFVAGIAVRDMPQTASNGGLTVQDLTHSAFVVVGIFILIMTLPDLIRTLIVYANTPEQSDISYGFALLFRCLLALALVLGARSAAHGLLWIRHARTSK